MFDNLSKKLDKAFQVLKGHGKITEINVAATLKEVRRALLDADVNYKIAKQFTDTVKLKALGQDVLTSLKPSQLMVKIVKDELTDLMGSSTNEIDLTKNPSIILMCGLQGSGKTTFSAKLAHYLIKKKSKNPLLVACDVYRPAAIEQLEVLANQINIPIFKDIDQKDPVVIANNAIKFAKKEKNDTIIIDTAGRLAVDEVLMKEISDIHKSIKPTETLFIVDSMTGQDAVNTAKSFNEQLNFDGVVLTKLDGDTRGGAALSIRYVVDKPIKLIGTGEKIDSIDVFHPERMADRILGMGDVISLVERAQDQFDEEEARKISKKLAKNKFGFDDFLNQINQIKKMGNLKDTVSMIPGMSKMKDVDIDNDSFKHIEALIQSMTPKERSTPKLIDHSRKKRIAKGAGREIQEINALLKQFEQMSKMIKMVQSGGSAKLMNMMQNFKQ